MCASDEFYFFPRATESIHFQHTLESFDRAKIAEHIKTIIGLKGSLEKLRPFLHSLEDEIDLTVLDKSLRSFLREFDALRVWQRDPSLYLKIILHGLDHLMTKFSFLKEKSLTTLVARLTCVEELLREAQMNLRAVPQDSLEISLHLAKVTANYIKCLKLPSPGTKSLERELTALVKKTLRGVTEFGKFLTSQEAAKTPLANRELMSTILKESFSCTMNLEEIFETAEQEYHKTLNALTALAKSLDRHRSWQQLLSMHSLAIKDEKSLIRRYASHIRKLKKFFQKEDIISIPETQDVVVSVTPAFLRPIRASASYNSPLTNLPQEVPYFYITADAINAKAIHDEYIFVTAHETYPGHHLLDSVRRACPNPIRRQIESPLFYEGWASYAERLIDEFGYIRDPIQKLIGLRRQAWRAVRAMLDVGLRIDRMTIIDGQRMLRGLGYSQKTARVMAKHYALTPGYQLCYTIGKYTIERLRENFAQRRGIKQFHDALLEGGQIPFPLVERRLKEKLCRKNS